MGDFKPTGLSPLKKAFSLKNIAVFDIETDRWLDYDELKDKTLEELKQDWHNNPITPFLLCYYDHVTKQEKIFEGENCLIKFLKFYLTKSHRDKICYAHNGGKFDFIALYQALMNNKCFNNFHPKIAYVNGGIMILRIVDENKHAWIFRDSLYLLKNSLENLSKSFNPKTKKLIMPGPPPKMKNSEHYLLHKDIWQKYCMNDCKSLAEILTMFSELIVNTIGGSVGLTTSSTALRTFRKKFLKITLPTYFTWNEFIRKGFYGGRTEVFNMYAPFTGKPYQYVDFNSMYPSVMHNNIFPVSLPKRVSYSSPWDCFGRCGLMECRVETPEDMDIPLLPYRDAQNHNKLLFPLGEWTATYEFALIEKALELGYKIKPLRTIEFKGDYLFKEYVDTIYPIKQNSVGALREIAKLLGNGLFGKFGEKSEREIIITEPDADIRGSYPIPNDPFGFTTKKIMRYCAHHQPAIPARVTALAMVKLYTEGFEHIQHKKGIVYYCDTDSIITNVKMPLSENDELGKWGLECEIRRAIFFAPKAYCYEYIDEKGEIRLIQKVKGFSRDFTGTLTFDDFLKALPPTNDYSAFEEASIHPASFKEINIRKLDGFTTLVRDRNIREPYDKRTIGNQFTTSPLVVYEP